MCLYQTDISCCGVGYAALQILVYGGQVRRRELRHFVVGLGLGWVNAIAIEWPLRTVEWGPTL